MVSDLKLACMSFMSRFAVASTEEGLLWGGRRHAGLCSPQIVARWWQQACALAKCAFLGGCRGRGRGMHVLSAQQLQQCSDGAWELLNLFSHDHCSTEKSTWTMYLVYSPGIKRLSCHAFCTVAAHNCC